MKKIRNSIKTAVLFFFFLLHKVIKPFSGKKDIAVLMYHSVDDVRSWKYGVSPRVFERQIAYLARRKNVVSLSEIVEYVYAKKELPDNSVALTFDDGYDDTYSVVFPLIKKYDLPITVFLTTNFSPMEKLGNLKRITAEQVREMAKSDLVHFEVHGHNHENLITLSDKPELLKKELLNCRDEIKTLTGRHSSYLAYAAGHKNRQMIDFAAANGFTAGFTIVQGMVDKSCDPFLIKRVQVDRTMNFGLFIMRLTRAVNINRATVNFLRGK